MKQRLAVARALAIQKLKKQGQAVTDEAIEREASILAEGLFVERPEDEIALTARALFESGAKPLSCDQPSRDGIHEDDAAVSQVKR
jgi:hypothetical protein